MAKKSFSSKDSGNSSYLTIGGFKKDGTKNPDRVEGHFLGVQQQLKYNSKTEYEGRVTLMLSDKEANRLGAQKSVILAANAGLNGIIERAEQAEQATGNTLVGSKVTIQFTGLSPKASKGGGRAKQYDIEFDTDDTVDVVMAQPAENNEDESEDQQAELSAAQQTRQARVNKMMNEKAAKAKK